MPKTEKRILFRGFPIHRLPEVQLLPGGNSTLNQNPSLDALGKLTATNPRATQSGVVTRADGRTDGRTDGRIDGRTDRRTDRRTEERMWLWL